MRNNPSLALVRITVNPMIIMQPIKSIKHNKNNWLNKVKMPYQKDKSSNKKNNARKYHLINLKSNNKRKSINPS